MSDNKSLKSANLKVETKTTTYAGLSSALYRKKNKRINKSSKSHKMTYSDQWIIIKKLRKTDTDLQVFFKQMYLGLSM